MTTAAQTAAPQMTHYMELLASNQPWNLIAFMAIPVILAEFIAVTELYLLFTKKVGSTLHRLNRVAGVIAGVWFTGIFVYLFANAVIPITSGGEWRGPFDLIAVGFYLLGVVPLGAIALIELGLLGRGRDAMGKLQLHATAVGGFLVVAHVAMIAGMLNPSILAA